MSEDELICFNNQKALLLHTVHVVRWTLRQGKANRQSQMPQIFSVDSVRQQRRFLLTRALSFMCSVCLFLCVVAFVYSMCL